MNTFGRIFRVSIFGESHGEEIGVVIDGVEPGIDLQESDFARDIDRRRSGAKGTTPRIEADEPHILSGVFEGHTTGAPLTIVFKNTNTRSQDYSKLIDVPRPGHADFTANVKYGGFQDPRGGGHFSGRLTLPLVAAGVVAKKILAETISEETNGHVQFRCNARLVEIGGIADETRWEAALDAAQKEGDSLGGIVECTVDGIPAGLGEPFWDSVESRLSHALFAIPGVRGVEFGDGFAAARMKGSEHNDCFTPDGIDGHEGLVTPATNHAGGINGGITNGNPLVFRVAFKPTSSIAKAQRTFDFAAGEMTELRVPGRHDICFALRTPVVVEAMAAIVLADLIDLA
ncbi:MAG: chorismate synthase [Bacteroidales bacterium]|nr:chorismate synthase [Bacteroidales bacterium]